MKWLTSRFVATLCIVSVWGTAQAYSDDGVNWMVIKDSDKLSDNPQTGLSAVFSDSDSGRAIVVEATCTKDASHAVQFKAIGFHDNSLNTPADFNFIMMADDFGVSQYLSYRYRVDSRPANEADARLVEYGNVIDDLADVIEERFELTTNTDGRQRYAKRLTDIANLKRLRYQIPFHDGANVLIDFSPQSPTMSEFLHKCRQLAGPLRPQIRTRAVGHPVVPKALNQIHLRPILTLKKSEMERLLQGAQ